VAVTEAFFALHVADMVRATAFYVDALGASVTFASARWSSLTIAGVRVALFLDPERTATLVGLHFVVSDLTTTSTAIARAGGRVIAAAIDAAPGVVIAEVSDTEGNAFTLRQA